MVQIEINIMVQIELNIYTTRNSGCYVPFFLAPAEGWGALWAPYYGAPYNMVCIKGELFALLTNIYMVVL